MNTIILKLYNDTVIPDLVVFDFIKSTIFLMKLA